MYNYICIYFQFVRLMPHANKTKFQNVSAFYFMSLGY